ncbi:MAG: AraC family transcriptional regulator [Colwellia sp.]|nr:AraC family transcriptional regulator [Colwellia sp.]
MTNWIDILVLALDLSSVILLITLIALINIGLKWLPSRNKMTFFLLLFLAFKLVAFSFFILSINIAFRLYVILLPSILLIGPLMTGFTQATLLMQRAALLDRKSLLIFLIGLIIIAPYLIYPHAVTQLPAEEQPLLLSMGVKVFVLLFVVTSSVHFIRMIYKFSCGSLYAVGYEENTYQWLKGVWFSMTLLWLLLLLNVISGVIEIPWGKISLSSEKVDMVSSLVDIIVLFSLTIVTALYCKKPPEKTVTQLCDISEKYEKSALSEAQAQEILSLVDQVMAQEKLFLDSELNIEKLASVINTPMQYLSQAINQYRSINFYELIANYRIEYAKVLLTEEPKKSVMTVAMDSGFNAKSTFNQAFKKLTGVTPTQFKKH